MAVQLSITCTSKGYGRASQWNTFDHRVKVFPNMEAAQRFIAEEYGKCKRQKMFQDGATAGDPPTHCGYVYGFRNEEYSHDSTSSCHSKSHWFEQHWVTFYNRDLIDMACRRPAAVRQGEKS